jgi:hypothetical protein
LARTPSGPRWPRNVSAAACRLGARLRPSSSASPMTLASSSIGSERRRTRSSCESFHARLVGPRRYGRGFSASGSACANGEGQTSKPRTPREAFLFPEVCWQSKALNPHVVAFPTASSSDPATVQCSCDLAERLGSCSLSLSDSRERTITVILPSASPAARMRAKRPRRFTRPTFELGFGCFGA